MSNIYCVDLLNVQLEAGNIVQCMQLWKVGNDRFLLVGTSLIGGNSIMTTGEAERYL